MEGKIHFASFMDDNDTEKIQAFLLESVANGCEGLMIKTLEENATYEPSKRSLNWLKVGRFFWNGEYIAEKGLFAGFGGFDGSGANWRILWERQKNGEFWRVFAGLF